MFLVLKRFPFVKTFCKFIVENSTNLKKSQMKNFTLVLLSFFSTKILWSQVTPNPSFDNWTTSSSFPSYTYPTSWDCPNSQTAVTGTFLVVKATAAADIHSGSAAVKLITKNVLSVNAPGIVTTGKLPTSTGGNITGGVPYNLRPDSIVGWYKYTPAGGDNGFFALALLGAGGNTDTIGSAFWTTPTTTVGTYTRFSAPIIYRSSNAVDTAVWVVNSSASGTPTSANVGSTLFADDLGVIINPSTNVPELEMANVAIGPNPASEYVFVNNLCCAKSIFELTDITGRKITEQKITGVSQSIEVNDFPAGLYLYRIIDENKTVLKTGKLIIQR